MRTKLRILGALGIVAALGAGAWVTSASAITTAKHFTLIAPDTERKTVDVGPRGASLGDRFIFSGPLQNARGEERGRIDGICTTTGVVGGAEEVRRQCVVTSTIGTANGETEIQTQGVGRVLAEDVILSVTGGSGRFQNARGQATFDYTTADQARITYDLIP